MTCAMRLCAVVLMVCVQAAFSKSLICYGKMGEMMYLERSEKGRFPEGMFSTIDREETTCNTSSGATPFCVVVFANGHPDTQHCASEDHVFFGNRVHGLEMNECAALSSDTVKDKVCICNTTRCNSLTTFKDQPGRVFPKRHACVHNDTQRHRGHLRSFMGVREVAYCQENEDYCRIQRAPEYDGYGVNRKIVGMSTLSGCASSCYEIAMNKCEAVAANVTGCCCDSYLCNSVDFLNTGEPAKVSKPAPPSTAAPKDGPDAVLTTSPSAAGHVSAWPMVIGCTMSLCSMLIGASVLH